MKIKEKYTVNGTEWCGDDPDHSQPKRALSRIIRNKTPNLRVVPFLPSKDSVLSMLCLQPRLYPFTSRSMLNFHHQTNTEREA